MHLGGLDGVQGRENSVERLLARAVQEVGQAGNQLRAVSIRVIATRVGSSSNDAART